MTRRQAECLAAIKRLTANGIPPSYEQIMREMGLTSKSPVHRLVHALKERGVLAVTPNRARTIAVRDEHAEAIPFDAMADAVAELMARGKRVYPAQIRKVMVEAYAAAA